MAFLNYFLMSLIAALGIFGGYFVGRIAKEELKIGEKYLKTAGQIILVLMILVFVFSLRTHKILQFLLFALVLSIFVYMKVIRRRTIYFPDMRLVHACLGMLFYLSSGEFLVLIGSLILMHGFPIGSLMYFKKESVWKIGSLAGIFIVVANFLYLIF